MDRNFLKVVIFYVILGQARKSLWIETISASFFKISLSVRLVRACGSKQLIYLNASTLFKVRLVRACGSKLLHSQFQSW